MAAKKGGKKPAPKKKEAGAKKANKHKLYERFEVKGDKIERKNPHCPKCGPGFLLATHKNRKYCGKCKYIEMK